MTGDYTNPTEKTQRKLNKVAAGLMEGKKATEALVDAGYSPSSRMVMPAVKKTLKAHLEEQGLTDEELARRIKAATECNTPLVFQGKRTGQEIPDNRVRVKALELSAELMGHKPGKEYSGSYDKPVNIQVNFGGTTGSAPLAREGGFTVNLPGKDPEQLPPAPDAPQEDEITPE